MTETIQQAAERLSRRYGSLVKAYEYRTRDGSLVFCNLRILNVDGRKTFRMMADGGNGFVLGRAESLKPSTGWPLYGLASLDRPGVVWVVEGEKDADSLHALGLPAVTSGSCSTDDNADWSPLAGRKVLLWPDNDKAGQQYAERLAEQLDGIASDVSMIDVASLGLAEKEDCSDWLAKHPQATAPELEGLPCALQKNAAGPQVKLICADTIVTESIDWIWRDWIAAGKMHLLGGQPGTGKTTIAMALAAIISNGGVWPDGTKAQRGSVVIWSGEDDPADTLVPRLRAAGADLSKIQFVKGVQDAGADYLFDPARHIEALGPTLAGIRDLRLLIVDPLVSAVAGDSHKNAEVRRGLQPLVDLARESRCGVLGVTHFSKGTGGRDPIERITGSLAFGALARIVLVTAKREASEDHSTTRFIARAKSNIGPDGGGFVYDIEQRELADFPEVQASSVTWGKALDGSARELLAEAEQRDEDFSRDAETFLREALADGPESVDDVRRMANERGLKWRTVQRASRKLSVESKRCGFGQKSTWKLTSRATVASVAPHNNVGASGATESKAPIRSMPGRISTVILEN